MAQGIPSVERATEKVQDQLRETSHWIERLARCGYVARGIVYLTIGLLALRALFGLGSAEADSQDALQTIFDGPLGSLLLGLLSLGLIAFVLWRLFQALVDPDGKGNHAWGVVQRAGDVLSAFIHGTLAYTAIRILLQLEVRDQNQLPKDWTALLFQYTLGQLLVGLVGLGILANGLWQLYEGCSTRFRQKLKQTEMDQARSRWATGIGAFAIAGRGLVLGLIGLLLLQATLLVDPNRAEGMGGALKTLAQQPFGPWLLGGAAAILIAYGLHNLIAARYRDIHCP